MTKGNRKILWYQHRTQGAKSITWLKNTLPVVDTLTSSQHKKRSVQFEPDL